MNIIKKIIIGTVAVGSVAIGATAFADRSGDSRQDRMIERISSKLQLDDSQDAALVNLATEIKETRTLMRGPDSNIRGEMKELISADTFDQGKALSMINDRAAALQANAPELVAAAAVFFDGLSAEQKDQIQEFANKRRRGHKHD